MELSQLIYSVYLHTTPSGKRYVGITSVEPEKRWQNGLGYQHNDYFTKAIKKYGWQNIKHEILFSGLTQGEAERKERELIQQFKSNQREHGYNLTDGGEKGKRYSLETRRLMSERKKGKLSCRKGVHLSNETKAKISVAHIGKPMPKEAMEICWNARRKRVAMMSKDGEVIATFNGTAEAARTVNGNNSNIVACAKGKRKTAFGYKWKYLEE